MEINPKMGQLSELTDMDFIFNCLRDKQKKSHGWNEPHQSQEKGIQVTGLSPRPP